MYSIRIMYYTEHIIQKVESTDMYKIIQISSSKLLYNIAFEEESSKRDFKLYIIQIINSILINYDLSTYNVDIQFNDYVIWIVYSYDILNESHISKLPIEIIQKTLLNLKYDDIKRICQTSTDFALVCKSDSFWRAKFNNDYGFNPTTT